MKGGKTIALIYWVWIFGAHHFIDYLMKFRITRINIVSLFGYGCMLTILPIKYKPSDIQINMPAILFVVWSILKSLKTKNKWNCNQQKPTLFMITVEFCGKTTNSHDVIYLPRKINVYGDIVDFYVFPPITSSVSEFLLFSLFFCIAKKNCTVKKPTDNWWNRFSKVSFVGSHK